MKNKTLWIIAGPNGSGKTTLVVHYGRIFKDKLPFINPDDIARDMDSAFDGKDNVLIQKAGKETIRIQKLMLNDGQSFGFETTFSGKRDLKIMEEAKKLGYRVKLAFIGLNSPILNLNRVDERVLKGGHYVAPKDIIRRYERAMNNLKRGIEIADSCYLFDNSKDKIYYVAKFKKNRLIKLKKEIPQWLINNFSNFKDKIES